MIERVTTYIKGKNRKIIAKKGEFRKKVIIPNSKAILKAERKDYIDLNK